MAKRVNAWRVAAENGGFVYFRSRERAYAFASKVGKNPQRVQVVGDKSEIRG